MGKSFRDTFPTLKLNKETEALFDGVEVKRVVSTSLRDKLCIYIESSRLIDRKAIRKMAEQIEEQLFKGMGVSVRIKESFCLSGQYNARVIMDMYSDSIFEELREYDNFVLRLVKRGDITFPEDNVLKLTLEDSALARARERDIVEFLSRILNERCGIGADISVDYKEPEGVSSRERIEHKLNEEVKRISSYKEEDKTGVSEDKMASENKAAESRTAGKMTGRSENRMGRSVSRSQTIKRSANPDVIYGRDFDDAPSPISELVDGLMEVCVRGRIIRNEVKELKSGKLLLMIDVTDYTDTIGTKLFLNGDDEESKRLIDDLAEGSCVLIKGTLDMDRFEHELTIGHIAGIRKSDDFIEVRHDDEIEKRVELHCHTKMSDMDGVSEVADILKCAASWGHRALAITDHGVVQGFTDAFHAIDKVRAKMPGFKVIYGMEGYLVDDAAGVVVGERDYSLDSSFVVFDIETTGLSPVRNNIIEIGAVKIEGGKVVDTFSTFVNPKEPIPFRIEQLTGINDSMVEDAPYISEVLPKFLEFSKDSVFVAHNADFDVSFIKNKAESMGFPTDYTYVDTLGLARCLITDISKYRLDNVAKALKISFEGHHRAVNDADVTAKIFMRFIAMLKQSSITNLLQLNEYCASNIERIRKLRSNHVIILAKNELGRINLYKLVSLSHLKYYHSQPKIPKSVLSEYREGLIIGSACEKGELYQAILDGKSDDEIARIVDFYDYLEVQPLGNNAFMLRENQYENINSEADLIEINKKIIELGDMFNKPVVATCDTHFLNPEDEVYRRIIMAGKGFKDADLQAPLYLRTTAEMLAEFDYLPYDKAYEIVVKNTNMIADMIDYIEPVRPDKCPPVIENSDEQLREICMRRAREIYGDKLPEQVSARLERELNSIISNGFAVMYIIAQKLVWKSMEDGYLVGSRGSVGSSLVATMAGITEVNPLPPHYYCTECHYYDFDSEEVKSYVGKAGCDMPNKNCPVCGAPLKKEGFDIPFETFLGFKGDKEPDIDLNFSGEYQSKAHKYTEVIFGAGQTYRAGTIGTLADKTAYGYVKNYFEERGVIKRGCEINRITQGCTGVRRTTGQHPGGIIVLPLGEEIESFTPIQHPANDMTTDIVTTHFDYHSIDHNLLKLDILGHDDPTMIRRLQDLTGTNPQEVPLDDEGVMSLFQNTNALGIKPSDIGGCPLGTLGIPEFGTDFAMGMLLETNPTAFSDLVRIAGLSHGTDVWSGNAQVLIHDGTATISNAICTRDDIMTYLISMGVDPAKSFSIMENVRKGKVAKGKCGEWSEWKQDMLDHNVPDWYVWSCEKIQYMFPKAHAAAYVMMAWRIAYYKINYPLAYYAAFFSIRATGFSYELMCQGRDKLEYYLEDYKKRSDELTKKEQDVLKDMRIVQEMYARGYDFMPIDIFIASAHECKIIDGKIMPHIGSIEGMGDKAADAVVEAVKGGPFLSRDDFRDRTKVNQKCVDKMVELGLLGDLPESNQLSLFDLFAQAGNQ